MKSSAMLDSAVFQLTPTRTRNTKQDNVEKAVVPYKSNAQPPEANGITSSQAKSKGQLLRVLETRKSMLHKEQGMAFARAVAAGFDIDYIPALMSFAECFEASRLMDACRNFMSLWKRKHESGLWLEIEASEVTRTPNHADFSAINGSGIVLSNNMVTEMDSESNGGKTNSGDQNNIQGQFLHHGFSPWPVHSPPGALPVFHPYPTEGIPYYPTYPGNGPFMQSGCPPMEDPRLHADQSMRHRRHSMGNRHNNTESQNWVIETSKTRFQDEVDVEREGLQTGDRRKKASRSDRRKSGNVVIRNINYITKTKRSSGSDSDSATETDEDKEIQESVKPSKRRGSSGKTSLKRLNSTDKKETDYVKEADGGHWQAFQTYLLKGVEEDRHAVNEDKFEVGKVDHVRRKKHVAAVDPLDFTGNSYPSSDVAPVNGQGYSNTNLERKLFRNANNDSFMVEHRVDDRNVNGNAIDMDTEFPKEHKKEGKGKLSNYQPDEMRLMPERGADKGSTRYDCALDYEMQAQAVGKKKGVLAHNTKPGSKMLDKVQKSKPTPSSSDRKKTVGPIRRGKTNKPSPLDEARARAERLRNYKADLQKMKKEKEEEDIKRLEALKKERQKRIAARSSSVTKLTTKSTMPSQQTKKQFQTNMLPTVHKASKFSDSEPRSSLPFQRFPIRSAAGGSNDSSKASKTSRLNTGSSLSVTSKLRRSVPLLPERKQDKGDGANNTKASITRNRRFSEPKMSSIRPNSLVKPRSSRTILRNKAVDETERKKISAIVNYDKDKIATLPELKIRIPKEKTQKLNGDNKPSMNSEGALLKRSETGISSTEDGDENPIIDKTVPMLECEKKPSSLDINDEKSRGKTEIAKGQDEKDKAMEKTKTVSSCVAVLPPASSLRTNMVNMNNTKNEPSKSSSTCIVEETYRAPYSRGSSLEDRCTRSSEYGKAPSTSLEAASIGTETFRAHVSDTRNSTLEKIPEVNENPQAKESPKGLRRLLKFGKKNHNSDTGSNMESDNARIEIGANSSSNEAPTLKNFLSRDETHSTNATPQKSTRTFSLLSPFRSNSREKKIMTA
ncbi:hypothetical protein TSUD_17270 [Trifolium subterraneum]|uniref:COP1-interacting protein 7 n=1 Tax=Trifolium subterraneum TaxID=3900 RepID=A0A2Z6MNS6_TRISU|nr:hypothetical protein TSUD_17270 [Trifolium subterraneum]